MELFEAGIYDSKDRPFRIKKVEDYFTVIELLEAMQEEVEGMGLVVWCPDE